MPAKPSRKSTVESIRAADAARRERTETQPELSVRSGERACPGCDCKWSLTTGEFDICVCRCHDTARMVIRFDEPKEEVLW